MTRMTHTAQVTEDVVNWLRSHEWHAVADDLLDMVRENGAHGAAIVLGRFIETAGDAEDHNPPWTRDVIALYAAWLFSIEVARVTRNAPDEGIEIIEEELRIAMQRPWKLVPGTPAFADALMATLERASEVLREANELIEQTEGLPDLIDDELRSEWTGALDRFDTVHQDFKARPRSEDP